MAGTLDLASIEVLGIAECDLDLPVASAHEWPCPSCGEPRPLDRAWALKVRNLVEPPLERAVVVCNDCFVTVGDLIAERVPHERITISSEDDPVELLRDAFDTEEVEIAFRS